MGDINLPTRPESQTQGTRVKWPGKKKLERRPGLGRRQGALVKLATLAKTINADILIL